MTVAPHRLFALLCSLTLIVGCHRSVESFSLAVQGDGDEEAQLVAIRDEGNRPAEAESVVVSGGEYRFAIEGKPLLFPESGTVAITGYGDFSGAELLLYEGDSPVARYPFGDHVSGYFDGSVTVRVPLRDDRSVDSFAFASGSSRGFTVERIALTGAPGAAGPGVRMVATTEVSPPFVLYAADEGAILHVGGLREALRDGTVVLHYSMDPASYPSFESGEMPSLTLRFFAESGDTTGEWRESVRPGSRTVLLDARRAGTATAAMRIDTVPEGLHVTALSIDTKDPPVASLDEIVSGATAAPGRDEMVLYRWDAYPSILVVDTGSYAFQARTFKRLAFYLEKRGFTGRFLSNDELAGRHGWNAHNYSADGLSAFFDGAASAEFLLNDEEYALRDVALRYGLIEEHQGRFLPGRGGLLIISRESGPELRRLLMTHEAMHGFFYEEPDYVRAVFSYWDQHLDAREREFWTNLLGYLTYEPSDRYLMVNEFQAYVLQQREAAVPWYMTSVQIPRLIAARPHQAEAMQIFLRDYPDTFAEAARFLNETLWTLTGFRGGGVITADG